MLVAVVVVMRVHFRMHFRVNLGRKMGARHYEAVSFRTAATTAASAVASHSIHADALQRRHAAFAAGNSLQKLVGGSSVAPVQFMVIQLEPFAHAGCHPALFNSVPVGGTYSSSSSSTGGGGASRSRSRSRSRRAFISVSVLVNSEEGECDSTGLHHALATKVHTHFTCMCVSVDVWMYVCVCTYARVYVRMDGWTQEQTDA